MMQMGGDPVDRSLAQWTRGRPTWRSQACYRARVGVRAEQLPLLRSRCSAHLLQRSLAGVRAAFAGLPADAAVLVFAGMLLALFAACPAGCLARLDGGAQNIDVRPRAARGHRARGGADVGAIKVQPNALLHLVDRLLGQASVGAGGAGLGAAISLLDALQEPVGRAPLNIGMGAHHLADTHGCPPRGA